MLEMGDRGTRGTVLGEGSVCEMMLCSDGDYDVIQGDHCMYSTVRLQV